MRRKQNSISTWKWFLNKFLSLLWLTLRDVSHWNSRKIQRKRLKRDKQDLYQTVLTFSKTHRTLSSQIKSKNNWKSWLPNSKMMKFHFSSKARSVNKSPKLRQFVAKLLKRKSSITLMWSSALSRFSSMIVVRVLPTVPSSILSQSNLRSTATHKTCPASDWT